jgi:hypothetical protein
MATPGAGARYLDLRVAYSPGKADYFFHHCLDSAETVQQQLAAVSSFLSSAYAPSVTRLNGQAPKEVCGATRACTAASAALQPSAALAGGTILTIPPGLQFWAHVCTAPPESLAEPLALCLPCWPAWYSA